MRTIFNGGVVDPQQHRPRPAHPLFVGGLVILWLSLDWPIGALGAGYLASVHMLQFLLMALVAPPMLVMGPSPDAVALLERPGPGYAVLRWLLSPARAIVFFSAIVLLTHLPPIVDALMATQLGSMATAPLADVEQELEQRGGRQGRFVPDEDGRQAGRQERLQAGREVRPRQDPVVGRGHQPRDRHHPPSRPPGRGSRPRAQSAPLIRRPPDG